MTEQKEIYKTNWTIKELCDEANVTDGYIRRLLLQGRIEGIKRGGVWFIPDSEVKRWLKAREAKRAKK